MKKTQRKSSRSSNSQKSPQKTQKAPKRRSALPLLIAGAVIVLLVAIGLVVYFMRDASPEDVVATVNGNAITTEQLDFQYNLLPESYRETFTRDQVLEQIIDEELIVQTAKRQGVNVSPEDINERVQAIMAQNELTPTDLQTNLADLNVTLEQFEQLIARQIIIERYLDVALEAPAVDNQTLATLYSSSLSEYKVGEQVTVRHVLISNQRPDAAVAAKRIYDAARNGTDFCELVANASDDRGSRNTCGQYTFPRNFMVPEFEEAAFAMEPGEFRLVQSQFGYHIMLKINSTPEGVKPFEEVYDEILREYEAADRSKQYRRIVEDLRSRATISYANGTTLLPQQPSTVSAPEQPVPQAPEAPAAPNETVSANVTVPAANVTGPSPNVTASANLTAPVPPNTTAVNVAEPVAPNITGPAANATESVPPNVTAPQNGTAPAPTPRLPEEPATTPTDTRALLRCIAEKSTLYGTSWNTDTQDARSLFARNEVPLRYVQCDRRCEGIDGYPTWEIDGEMYLGRMTVEQLRDAAQCD